MAIAARGGLIDLSHDITEGMVTYKGLPGPHLCDYWSRAETAANYDDGATFQIGRIEPQIFAIAADKIWPAF